MLAALRAEYVTAYGSHDVAEDDLDGCTVLTVRCHGEEVGMVALASIDEETVLARRLYVCPPHRGHGHGWELARLAATEARRQGYRHLVGELSTEVPASLAIAARLRARPSAPFGTYIHDPRSRYVDLDLDTVEDFADQARAIRRGNAAAGTRAS